MTADERCLCYTKVKQALGLQGQGDYRVQVIVSARHGQLSAATQEKVTEKVEKLRRFFGRITRIEVTVNLENPDAPSVEACVSAEHTSDFYFDERGFVERKMESLKDIADRVGERIAGLAVRDVMVKNPLTTRLDQPISETAKSFVAHHVHRLPVTDAGILVGIITTTDLVRLVAEKRIVAIRH